jgi:hypothetical protein
LPLPEGDLNNKQNDTKHKTRKTKLRKVEVTKILLE